MVKSPSEAQNRSMKPEFPLSRRLTRNIVLRYIFYSSLWIVLSDFLLTTFINDLELLNTAQTLKGWGFVLVTSSLLYKLIKGSWYQVDSVQQKLYISREELKSLFAAMNELIFILDRQGRYVKIIPTQSKGLYKPIPQLLNKTVCEVFPTEQGEYFYSCILEVLETQVTKQITYTYISNDDGKDNYFEAQISPLSEDRVIWVARDITARKEMEKKLEEYAFHDPLTHLPNKTALLYRIEEVMTDSTTTFAVLVIEIENFNKIKYSLGHELAENLLIAIAQRIEVFLPPQEEVARVGDKSLAVLIKNYQGFASSQELAQHIYNHINVSIDLSGQEICSPIKIGIACNDVDLELKYPKDWLHAADTAMSHSKSDGTVNCVLFNPLMHQKATASLRLETDLRRAILQQQLEVFYQPIVFLQTQEIVGFETLIRWQHPTQGFMLPDEFLYIAKETGLISTMDWWVMKQSCQQLKKWQQNWKAAHNLYISIN